MALLEVYVGDGRAVTVYAGTRVQLSSISCPAKKVFVQAETDNGGIVVVGGSTVVAALATRRGISLYARDDVLPLDIDDLNTVWLDSTVSGEGLTFVYLN